MSSRVLCSIGVGPGAELLAIARPSFSRYAERHGYELVLENRVLAPERPTAWSKLVLLRELLAEHELVLWIDADAVIVDDEDDIDAALGDARLGLVEHRLGPHRVPSTGVLVLRRDPVVLSAVERAWEAADLLRHPWFEQAALARELGYRLPLALAAGARGRAARVLQRTTGREPWPCRPARATALKRVTCLLDPAWNAIPYAPPVAHPRIRHWPGEPHAGRVLEMTKYSR